MGKEMKTNNADKLGFGKLMAWSTRDLSLGANFIVLSFLTIYCTNTLHVNPLTVGTMLMLSKIIDAVTDLFAGYLIDKNNTRLGKGRPYEFAILGVWACTWLLFSCPANYSDTVKIVWIFVMYMFVNSIFTTLLNASSNPYMVRAFGSEQQRVKLASFGGIIIMIASILINMIFPIAMNRIATSPAGWSKMIALFALPLGLIGILRFFFVKETEKIDDTTEKITMKDVSLVFKNNKYVYIIIFVQLIYSLVTGTGVVTYYYTYIVKNVELMGIFSGLVVIVVPLMAFFPMILKRLKMGKFVQIGCIIYAIGSMITFLSNGSIPILLVGGIFAGIGTLPITYLVNLMALDCGTYNAYIGQPRMDGTIGAIKGFASKLGGALGSGSLGVMLYIGNFDENLAEQAASANFAISALYALIPAILFVIGAIILNFYTLDSKMPEINSALAARNGQATK